MPRCNYSSQAVARKAARKHLLPPGGLCEAFSMTVALKIAAEHDLAGRHDDAINALARATQNGDLEAMTELGKRLVGGDRAPLLPKDGAGLLVDAARAGHAE